VISASAPLLVSLAVPPVAGAGCTWACAASDAPPMMAATAQEICERWLRVRAGCFVGMIDSPIDGTGWLD
jgi:hypothetical protein